MIDAVFWWTGLAAWGIAGAAGLVQAAFLVCVVMARRMRVVRGFIRFARQESQPKGSTE